MNSTTLEVESLSPKAVALPKKGRHIPIGFMVVGLLILLNHGFVTDYVRAVFATDGIYVSQPVRHLAGNKGGEISHTFRIYNTRPRHLGVEAQPDCGCTGVSWAQATIPPFGWKDLTTRMRGSAGNETGSTSVSVGIRTDHGVQPWRFVFLEN